MGFVWFLLSRSRGISSKDPAGVVFACASILASAGGMCVVLSAEVLRGVPGVPLLALASVVLVCFLLAIDWFSSFHFLAPAAVIEAALVVFIWSSALFKPESWQEQFFYAGAIYLVFLLYPLVLGARAGKRLTPYLAAVMASGVFFFFRVEFDGGDLQPASVCFLSLSRC
jgi:hypothetical protein